MIKNGGLKMKLLIVVTGGTFGSKKNNKNSLNVSKKEEIINVVKELLTESQNELNFEYSIISPLIILSENMNPKHWEIIINSILQETQNKNYDGILIIHGTDTMPYTASAIAYIENLSKRYPIVITGANYPVFFENTDAKINLKDSLKVMKYFVEQNITGSFIVFNGINDTKSNTNIHLGSRVKKDKWEKECYRSFYLGKKSIGELTTANLLEFDNSLYSEIFPRDIKYKNISVKFNDTNIIAIKIYPGLDPEILINLFKSGKKYFLLEIYNSGTAPANYDRYSLIEPIKYITGQGGAVFAISQHEGGKGAQMNLYETSIDLKKAWMIPLGNMIWESAIPKLMLASGNFDTKEEIIKYMTTNIAGETF
jgi:glutamyl-tRNA(Gln) amidotransferase subunit D